MASLKFTPKCRQAWRNWLEEHHAEAQEIWLVFFKRHTGKPTLTYNDAVEEALCFGWIDGIKRSIDDERYMHRFSPRKPDSKWSESNKKRAARMFKAGQMAPAGEKAIELAKKNAKWKELASARINFSMPPELNARLKRNKKAATFFASLAPSYQRQYVAWIVNAKKPETKKRRLDEAVRLLKNGKRLGMR